jgi:hypothetical protein
VLKIFSILGEKFRERVFAAFPLTLTLSQRERGQPAVVCVFPDARPANPALHFSERRSAFLPLPMGEGRGEGGRSNKTNSLPCAWRLAWLLLFLSTFIATAQTNPPPASYIRTVTNDVPNQPLVTVTVTGASNISCLTIEEDLPSPASAVSISGDGVYLPAQNVIRWGPYFNTVATNVSYRLTGLPATYPVNGGSWMDGHWNFSSGVTMVTVLPASGGSVPTAPPQVAPPTFAPASGASVPTNVTISCTTTGAVIYYTLDGSLPTQSSTLYTGKVSVVTASVMRAVGFTNGWTPSVASVAYYGLPAVTANAQVSRSVNTNIPAAPLVTFSVTPGTNANCVAVTESLPPGLAATNVTAGGSYIASNNVVLWGPFFGTNVQTLSYQAVGQLGTYPVQASWSVDGVGGSEAAVTNIVVASATGGVPTAPPQAAMPTFSPASGSNVPVNVTISSATAGATIYYTLDGSLPTQVSTLYGGVIHLVSASTIRAVAFTNSWMPSVAGVAYYGSPAATANAQVTRSVNTSSPSAPVVTFSVTPGTNANCVAVTESLPPGLAATHITAGGNYIASNNVVLWGPFFGTNTLTLSYQAVGLPGSYTVRSTWSVDGISSSEAVGTNIVVASASGSSFPTAPPQEPVPTLFPAIASNLPVTVSISSSDAQSQVYYTTDGSLPMQSSTPYTTSLTFSAPTTLRAMAFRAGYLPSVSAVGNYVAALPTNSLSLVRSISGNGTFLPSVTLTATPLGTVSCYAVTETLVPGLTPSALATNAVWNPTNNTIYWGPFLDNQSRALTYELSGPSGNFPLTAQGSFDGHPATVTGVTAVSLNTAYVGSSANYASCIAQPITFTVNIDPAPGIVTVDTASGTINWGDGTQSAFTQPVTTLQKLYTTPGTYTATLTANWTGHTTNTTTSGNGTITDAVQIYSSCGEPVIVNQPTNQVVVAGATAQFTVGASSQFPLSYQWYFNQTNMIVYPASFATLMLPSVTVNAAGYYSVVVTNAYGSVTSSVATLTVVTPLVHNANGSVTLGFAGIPSSTIRVFAATNLAPPITWQPVFTNSNVGTNVTWQFTDTNAVYFPQRFYRFSTP